MALFSGLWSRLRGQAKPTAARPPRHRLTLESLEDRCVPTATVQNPLSSAVIRPPAGPTSSQVKLDALATKNGVQIARGQLVAIQRAITRLRQAHARAATGTLARPLLVQSIQVLQGQKRAMSRMYNFVRRAKLTKDQGIIKVFALEAKFAHVNAALQAHQTAEIVANRMMRFRQPVRY